MKEKNWRFRGRYEEADGGLLEAIIRIRGFNRPGALFEDGAEDFHDPFLLKDMDRAVERILLARERGERAAVYGDYDADGVTAAYIMIESLRLLGIDTLHYIPDRFEEGYGVHSGAIERIAKDGASLIITVDTGITALSEVQLALSLGMDMIITDHHKCPEKLPEAVAIINPHRGDCKYPFKELCGAAVAFKLSSALLGTEKAESLFIEAAAIGTVADAMPIIGENRAIVKRGLSLLENTLNPGLEELISQAGFKGKKLNSAAIGFGIAPRINAAGRMESAEAALELLLCGEGKRACELCGHLCSLNAGRRETEAGIMEECLATLEKEAFFAPRDGIIVLSGEGWHSGVIGIVAARLVERYSCPVILISIEEEIARGSGRSVEGFNLYEAIGSAKHLLSRFGGHEMAAGFTIERQNIDEFKSELGRFCREKMPAGGFEQSFDIDFEVGSDRLTLDNIRALDRLEPYGEGNPRPVFSLSGVKARDIREVGGRHTKFSLVSGGKTLPAIFFGRAPSELGLSPEAPFDAAFEPDIDDYGGVSKVQLIIRAIRPADSDRLEFEAELKSFGAIVSGVSLEAHELASALPGRREMGDIWRNLLKNLKNRRLSADLRILCRSLRGKRRLLRFLVGLEAFSELGLMEYTLEGFYINGVIPEVVSKVNLEDSKLLGRIRDMAGSEAKYDQH